MLLADELTDIKDHLADSEIYQSLCSFKPGMKFGKSAVNEIKNAEWLIERIIFFGGALNVSRPDVKMMSKLVSDRISKSNDDVPATGIAFADADKLAQESDEQDTADLLKRIRIMQASHNEWFGIPMFT